MSTLAVNTITDANGGSNTLINGVVSAPGGMMFRNRIINGDMRIDQRNAGASVTPTSTADNVFLLDRWATFNSVGSKFSVQQNAGSVTPPIGFQNYLGVTSLAATVVGASERYVLQQPIEGFNAADLDWGTANAKTVTLSFWVRSSLTGTFGGSLNNSALNRSYPFTYSVSSTDTWEYKTVTIAGDTSGTWLKTNGLGIRVYFGLGVGSSLSGTAGSWSGSTFFSATGATSVVGTNGATFYLTGVQLEVGSVATPFERRPYGTELMLCQRYFLKFDGAGAGAKFGNGWATDSTTAQFSFGVPVQMRTNPSFSYSAMDIWDSASILTISSATSVGLYPGELTMQFTTSGLTTYRPCSIRQSATDGYMTFTAEL